MLNKDWLCYWFSPAREWDKGDQVLHVCDVSVMGQGENMPKEQWLLIGDPVGDLKTMDAGDGLDGVITRLFNEVRKC